MSASFFLSLRARVVYIQGGDALHNDKEAIEQTQFVFATVLLQLVYCVHSRQTEGNHSYALSCVRTGSESVQRNNVRAGREHAACEWQKAVVCRQRRAGEVSDKGR